MLLLEKANKNWKKEAWNNQENMNIQLFMVAEQHRN